MATQDRLTFTAWAAATGRWRPGAADAVAVVTALVVLGPALLPGYVLLRDMMFVPDPVWSPRLLGLTGETARAVPSDLSVYLAALIVPAWLVQKVALFGALVLAGTGAARLVGSAGRLAAVTAAVAAIWNPWVGERLLMGHWAVLLGYGTVPWIALLAARRLREGGRWPGLAAALSVAGLMGASAQLLATLALGGAVVAAFGGPDRVGAGQVWRRAWAPLALHAAWAVPWVAASVVGRVGASDPTGFEVFAPTSDTPFGVVLSILTGGGIWNTGAVPPGRNSAAAVGAVLLVLVGAWGVLTAKQRSPGVRALVYAGLAGLILVGLAAWGPTQGALAAFPGGGLLRDATRQSGPWVIVIAVGLGLAVGHLNTFAWGQVRWLLPLVPVLTLPLLGFGVGGALRSVDVPPGVTHTAGVLNREPTTATIVVLPFATTRTYAWNAARPSLTPWSRSLRGEVIESSALVIDVGLRPVTVAGEDPRTDVVMTALRAPEPATALADLGVEWLVVDDPDVVAPDGAVLVEQTPQARVYRLIASALGAFAQATENPPVGGEPTRAVLLADGAALLLIGLLAGSSLRGAKVLRRK